MAGGGTLFGGALPGVGPLTGPIPSPPTGAGPAPAGEKRPGPEEGSLRPGELVQVRLAGTAAGEEEGLATIEIGGRALQAQLPPGLPPGKPVLLEVVSPGPPPTFKVPDGAGELTRLLRSVSIPSVSWEEASARILTATPAALEGPQRSFLEGLQHLLRLPPSGPELASALERLLQNSGLFHEALLARGEVPDDLKTLALRLLSTLANPSPLAGPADALLRHVEAHQARSLLEGGPVLPFFLPWGGEGTGIRGELAVEERSGSGAQGRSASGALRIRLEMPLLGPVEARVRWSPEGTAVRLLFGPSVLSQASARLDELSSALSEAGVRVRGVHAEQLEPPAQRPGRGLLEVRA